MIDGAYRPAAPGAGTNDQPARREGKGGDGRSAYLTVLRLRHIHPNGWQRALLLEGVIALAAVLVLADLASAWLLLVLPAVVTALVKLHDVLQAALDADQRTSSVRSGTNVRA